MDKDAVVDVPIAKIEVSKIGQTIADYPYTVVTI